MSILKNETSDDENNEQMNGYYRITIHQRELNE